MWRLYVEECEKAGNTPVKESKYKEIFCEGYNISFFKLKKDHCSLFEAYNNRSKQTGTIDENLEKDYKNHQLMNGMAREEKEKDKRKSKEDPSYFTATFDLQAVLTTSCSLVSELYYS